MLLPTNRWGGHGIPIRPYTSQHLSLSSRGSVAYKTGLVHTLMFRLFTICSNWQLIHSEIEHLRLVMRRNSYPEWLLNNVIKRFLARLYVVKNSEREVEDTRTFHIYLPYLGPLTAKTEQSINRLFRQYMPTVCLKIDGTICRFGYNFHNFLLHDIILSQIEDIMHAQLFEKMNKISKY